MVVVCSVLLDDMFVVRTYSVCSVCCGHDSLLQNNTRKTTKDDLNDLKKIIEPISWNLFLKDKRT